MVSQSDNHHHPQAIRISKELFGNDELRRQVNYLQMHQEEISPDSDPQPLTTWANMANILGPVQWAWSGWLPKGMLTILAGESGAGKSALALRICGCYLRGDNWPDGSKFMGEIGSVIWCEAEAAQALNLDRAKAWGLPIEKIYTPLSDPLADIKIDLPEHAADLAQKAFLPEVRLIVVDSLRGMHRGDENSSETMNTIKWLAEMARDSGKDLILTHHLRKRSIFDGEGVELERLRGSSAIVQTARLVWALDVPDPQTKDIKRLQVIKSNLGKFPDPIGVTISETGVKFVTPPETPKVESKVDQAVDLLMAILQKGPISADQVEKEFNNAGISIPTMKRAKAKLGVVSAKKKTCWYWSLPGKEENVL
jgi:putative DNA primase/helicase